jgi:hypothetical protein
MTENEFKFEVSGVYVNTELNQFGESMLDLINIASQLNKVELKSLKFISGIAFDPNAELKLKDIIRYKIPIFDYFIFINLPPEFKSRINWTVNTNRSAFNESQVSFSVLYIYFMVMTRNKFTLSENEKIPAFLMRFMVTAMSLEDIRNCLSENDLNVFSHTWIKSIKVNLLSMPLKNRFKQGIAGMRLFSIFRDYEPNKVIDASIRNCYHHVKKIATEGPYWEMHNLFQGNELASMSINANLQNLLLDCYDDDMITSMIKQKALFKYPIYNSRHVLYRSWGESFSSLYKLKLIFD